MEATKTKWKIDPAHSEILFKVKHLMITNVKGEFRSFEANVLSDGNDFSNAEINVEIDATSIYTNNENRDTHLKSADFFDVNKFPTASFEITKISEAPAGGDYNTILDGNLTLKGITKPASFNANVKVANGELSIATEPKDFNRDEFGIKFQMPAAEGLIKNEINVQMSIKAIEKK